MATEPDKDGIIWANCLPTPISETDVAIYCLVDENDMPFYVGQTVNPKTRLQAHRNPNKHTSHLLASLLEAMQQAGQTFYMKVIHWCPDSTSYYFEQRAIENFNDEGYHLFNLEFNHPFDNPGYEAELNRIKSTYNPPTK